MEVLQSCRCCLQRAPDKDLTTPYTHFGTTEIYSDMLKECFEIHVTLGGDGECGICDMCVRRLRDASDFKLQVQRSQLELQDVLQAIDAKPAIKLKRDTSGDILYAKPAIKLKRDTSGDILYEEPDTKAEELDDAASDHGTLQPYGKYKSRGRGSRRDHTYAKTECPPAAVPLNAAAGEGPEPARPVSARAREQLSLTCSVRLERLRGDEAPHASQTSLGTSRRNPRRATSMQDMPDDTAGLRAEEQAHTCCICGEHFTDKSTLIEHVNAHVTQTEISITYSSKKHEQATGVQRTQKNLNKRIYPNNKSYACKICNKQFTEKRSLTMHIRRHNEQGPYESDVCSQSIELKTAFKKHQPKHTRGKRYTCNRCGKQFKYIYYLDRHIRTHTGQKPFMCDVCGKTFADSSTLRRHRQIHTGIQPHNCDICSKKFTYKGDLVRHVRIHTGQKLYTCDVCSQTFGDISHFRRHKQTHTGDKPYVCEICGKQFTRKNRLTIHVRKHT